jgi:FixJ family two-component response regulator
MGESVGIDSFLGGPNDELQSRLISQGHKTPTIFITALPCERIRDCALVAGAIGFLRKPFRERDLVQLISAAMRTSDGNL